MGDAGHQHQEDRRDTRGIQHFFRQPPVAVDASPPPLVLSPPFGFRGSCFRLPNLQTKFSHELNSCTPTLPANC
jgi:hypothetical protein